MSPLRCQLFRGINNDQGSPCPRHQHSAEKMKAFYSRYLVSTYCVLDSMAAPMGEVWLDQMWPVVGKGSLGWCILDYLSKDVNYSCLEWHSSNPLSPLIHKALKILFFQLMDLFLNILFCIGVQQINQVVTVAGGQQGDSTMHTPVSILPQTPLACRLSHHIEQSSLGWPWELRMCYHL